MRGLSLPVAASSTPQRPVAGRGHGIMMMRAALRAHLRCRGSATATTAVVASASSHSVVGPAPCSRAAQQGTAVGMQARRAGAWAVPRLGPLLLLGRPRGLGTSVHTRMSAVAEPPTAAATSQGGPGGARPRLCRRSVPLAIYACVCSGGAAGGGRSVLTGVMLGCHPGHAQPAFLHSCCTLTCAAAPATATIPHAMRRRAGATDPCLPRRPPHLNPGAPKRHLLTGASALSGAPPRTPARPGPARPAHLAAPAASAPGVAPAAEPETVILEVKEMKCGGCSAAVKRILLTHPQVQSAAVNLLTETAAVKVR